jgi:hypothetical protein
MMTKKFQSIVKEVGSELLAAGGFQFRNEGEGFLTFWRPRKPGLSEGILVYRDPKVRAFAVEIAVAPEGQQFGWASFSESGMWQELGLRKRLGILIHGDRFRGDSFDRDFYRFDDEKSLRAQLQVAFAEVLRHGPDAWNRLSHRLRPES